MVTLPTLRASRRETAGLPSRDRDRGRLPSLGRRPSHREAPPRCSTRACSSGGGADGGKGVGLATRIRELPLAPLAAFGATVGTALDLIHGRAGVLEYNTDAGGLVWTALRDAPQIGDQPVSFVVAQTSVWVPVLLAAFYAVDGGLYLLLCRRRDEAVTKPSEVLVRLGVLGMLLQTSAILYENYVPYAKIRAVLGALALLNFVSFEKSLKREGARVGRTAAAAAIKSLGLSVFAGIAAPVIETLLIDRLHLWSYPRPDAFPLGSPPGFPSWVPFCYFFYHPFLFSLAAWLQDLKDGRGDDDDNGGGGKRAPEAISAGS